MISAEVALAIGSSFLASAIASLRFFVLDSLISGARLSDNGKHKRLFLNLYKQIQLLV